MKPVRVAILTCSDLGFRGEREDRSGDLIQLWCEGRGSTVVARVIVADETPRIVPHLLDWCDGGSVDVVICTGGTGFSPRDRTVEAARAVIEREAPGLMEWMRRAGEAATPYSSLSRGVAGIRARTLLVTMPGSPGGVRDGLEVLAQVVDHGVALLRGEETQHVTPGTD